MPAPVPSESTDRTPLARLGGAAVIVAAVFSAGVHVWVQPREPLPAIERADAWGAAAGDAAAGDRPALATPATRRAVLPRVGPSDAARRP